MSELNPKLEPGDRIILLHMDDYLSPVKIGTKGTVTKVVRVPFGLGIQYSVKWDSGSSLDIIPELDSWIKTDSVTPNKKITESVFKQELESMMKHKDLIKNLDYRTIMDYLELVRKSGLVNMFQATPFLMYDSENLHKLIYGVGGEPEEHPELFENIDEIRNILILEVIRRMEQKGVEFTENKINREFEKLCKEMMSFYFSLYNSYFKK